MKVIRLLLPFLRHNGYRISFANIYSYILTCRMCSRIYTASGWISIFFVLQHHLDCEDRYLFKKILNLHHWSAYSRYSITFSILHNIICKERDRMLQLRFLVCLLKFTSEVLKKREKKEWFYEGNFRKIESRIR